MYVVSRLSEPARIVFSLRLLNGVENMERPAP